MSVTNHYQFAQETSLEIINTRVIYLEKYFNQILAHFLVVIKIEREDGSNFIHKTLSVFGDCAIEKVS